MWGNGQQHLQHPMAALWPDVNHSLFDVSGAENTAATRSTAACKGGLFPTTILSAGAHFKQKHRGHRVNGSTCYKAQETNVVPYEGKTNAPLKNSSQCIYPNLSHTTVSSGWRQIGKRYQLSGKGERQLVNHYLFCNHWWNFHFFIPYCSLTQTSKTSPWKWMQLIILAKAFKEEWLLIYIPGRNSIRLHSSKADWSAAAVRPVSWNKIILMFIMRFLELTTLNC